MTSYAVDDFLARSPKFQVTYTAQDGHVYGIQTSQLSVTTASQALLQVNARRISWTITNFGTGQCYISWVSPALTTRDFPLLSGGGSLETAMIDDKTIAQLALWTIGDAATTLGIIEVVLIN